MNQMRWCFPSLCVFRMLLCSPAQHRSKSHLKVPIPVRKEDSLLVAQHIPGLIQMAPVPQWTLPKAHSCNKIPTALLGVTEKNYHCTACLHKKDNRQKRQSMHCQRLHCVYIFEISESAVARILNSSCSDQVQRVLGDSGAKQRQLLFLV